MSALLRRFSGERWLAGVIKALAGADRALQLRTTGRASLTALAGMPALLLTTTGRRSGQPRTVPLTFVRHDGGLLVVGSNFGQAEHPAWSANLLARPAAKVTVRGAEWPVRARLLGDDEKAAVWPQLLRLWPGYAAYQERSGRNIRVFLLTPDRPPEDGAADDLLATLRCQSDAHGDPNAGRRSQMGCGIVAKWRR